MVTAQARASQSGQPSHHDGKPGQKVRREDLKINLNTIRPREVPASTYEGPRTKCANQEAWYVSGGGGITPKAVERVCYLTGLSEQTLVELYDRWVSGQDQAVARSASARRRAGSLTQRRNSRSLTQVPGVNLWKMLKAYNLADGRRSAAAAEEPDDGRPVFIRSGAPNVFPPPHLRPVVPSHAFTKAYNPRLPAPSTRSKPEPPPPASHTQRRPAPNPPPSSKASTAPAPDAAARAGADAGAGAGGGVDAGGAAGPAGPGGGREAARAERARPWSASTATATRPWSATAGARQPHPPGASHGGGGGRPASARPHGSTRQKPDPGPAHLGGYTLLQRSYSKPGGAAQRNEQRLAERQWRTSGETNRRWRFMEQAAAATIEEAVKKQPRPGRDPPRGRAAAPAPRAPPTGSPRAATSRSPSPRAGARPPARTSPSKALHPAPHSPSPPRGPGAEAGTVTSTALVQQGLLSVAAFQQISKECGLAKGPLLELLLRFQGGVLSSYQSLPAGSSPEHPPASPSAPLSASLDLQQFKVVMGAYGVTDAFAVEHLFSVFDAERRGRVDFASFAATVSKLRRSDRSTCELLFHIYNYTKTGALAMPEVYQMLGGTASPPSSEEASQIVAALFGALDGDENGRIQKHEFVAGLLERPLMLELLNCWLVEPMLLRSEDYSLRKEKGEEKEASPGKQGHRSIFADDDDDEEQLLFVSPERRAAGQLSNPLDPAAPKEAAQGSRSAPRASMLVQGSPPLLEGREAAGAREGDRLSPLQGAVGGARPGRGPVQQSAPGPRSRARSKRNTVLGTQSIDAEVRHLHDSGALDAESVLSGSISHRSRESP